MHVLIMSGARVRKKILTLNTSTSVAPYHDGTPALSNRPVSRHACRLIDFLHDLCDVMLRRGLAEGSHEGMPESARVSQREIDGAQWCMQLL